MPITGVSNYPENENYGINQGEIDMETDDFGREQFKRMIERTFREYYPREYNSAKFNVQEYIDVVSKE